MNDMLMDDRHQSREAEHCLRRKICIVIATKGRPRILPIVLRSIAQQSLPADLTILSCVDASDVEDIVPSEKLRVVFGAAGSSVQRNTALNIVTKDTDFVVFMDDDFVAHPGWLAAAVDVFESHPGIVGVTGTVIADGIGNEGISEQDALKLLAAVSPAKGPQKLQPVSPYGCNMAFRMSSIRDLRFDEKLVLYGWQEDRDFGARAAREGGQLVKISGAMGVHLGVKTGRVPGRKLGYSQVVNPVYLWRKGTMTTWAAASHVARNLCANAARSIAPEPHVDRIGRFQGNLIGFLDLIKGKLTPERASSL